MRRGGPGLGLGLACVLAATGCAGQDARGTEADGYSHAVQRSPVPALAGREVVEWQGFAFLACPPLVLGEPTPLLDGACLTPGDAGHTRYGEHSMLEASVGCADGRTATDAGSLGIGFVGEPLVPPHGPRTSPEVRRCLSAALDEAVSGG